MQKYFAIAFILLVFSGCKKEIPDPPTESTSNTAGWNSGASFNSYHITFFTSVDPGTGPITVQCGTSTGTIDYYFNYNPGCGSMGCANFDLPPGVYNYSSSNFKQGTITTGAVQCITINI